VRALLNGKSNVRTIVGEPEDPHLPEPAVDSVLIANTYHELTAPGSVLQHLSQALRHGGRLVVVDRSTPDGDSFVLAPHHILSQEVQTDLEQHGFEIIDRQDRFIDRPGDELWWLIPARKP